MTAVADGHTFGEDLRKLLDTGILPRSVADHLADDFDYATELAGRQAAEPLETAIKALLAVVVPPVDFDHPEDHGLSADVAETLRAVR